MPDQVRPPWWSRLVISVAKKVKLVHKLAMLMIKWPIIKNPGFFLKKYCGAPGGPNIMTFGIMVHDPLYFEVGIVSGPTDPPNISKNAQMC